MQFSKSLIRQYLLVFSAALIFYIASGAPGLLWQDSGMIQYRVLNNDVKGGLGLALSHPLYYIVSIGAKYIPIGNIIHRINIVAAAAAAFAIANIFILMKLWIDKFWPAAVSALTLAICHTFWWHAAVVETYDMYLALFLAELIFLLMYLRDGKSFYIYLVGLFNGLAIAVHMFAVIPLACYGIYLIYLRFIKKIRTETIFLFILFWIIGALPYEYLIAQQLVQTKDFPDTIRSAFFGSGWENAVLNTAVTSKIIKEDIFFIGMNFPTFNLLFIIPGFYAIFKYNKAPVFGRFLLVLFFLFLLFACRYTVPDRYAFFLPFYAVVSLIMGLGVYSFQQKYVYVSALVFTVMPAVIYIFLPAMTEKYYPVFKNMRHLPYRNEYTYFFHPWKTGYYGADKFAREALENTAENSLIFADGTSLYPLVITKRNNYPEKKIDILGSHGSYNNISGYTEKQLLELIDSHPSYVVSKEKGYCPSYISENYSLINDGVLYRIVKNKNQSAY